MKKYPEMKSFLTEYHSGDVLFPITADKNGLFGVYNTKTKKNIIPHQYERINYCGAVNSPYFMFFNVKKGNERSILDYYGKTVFKSTYDNLNATYYGIKTENNGKYGVVTYEGQEIIPPKYDNIEAQYHPGELGGKYYIVQTGNKYGVIDNHGKVVISLQHKQLVPMPSCGHFFLYNQNSKFGVVDIYNRIIIPPKYDSIEYSEMREKGSFFKVCIENQCSVVDINGTTIIPSFKTEEREAVVKLTDSIYAKVNYLNMTSELIDNKAQSIKTIEGIVLQPIADNYISFSHKDGLGVIDYQGNVVMTPQNGFLIKKISDNGLIIIHKNGKYGIIYTDKIILEPIYHKIYFYRGHVMVLNIENGEKYYYIASIDDFAKNNGDLSKFSKYHINQYKKSETGNCIKFVKPNGEDLYCDKK